METNELIIICRRCRAPFVRLAPRAPERYCSDPCREAAAKQQKRESKARLREREKRVHRAPAPKRT